MEAFTGAKVVREQYFKDLEVLFAEGALVREPWKVIIPAIPERNAQATTVRGVCHTLLRGGHGFQKTVEVVQYSCTRDGKFYRPIANRVPLMVGTQEQVDLLNNKLSTVSRLCANKFCLNPDHMVLELGFSTIGRSYCAGPTMGCAHNPPCLLPGRNFAQISFEKIADSQHPPGEEAAEEEDIVYEVSDDDSDESESIGDEIADHVASVSVVDDVVSREPLELDKVVNTRMQKAEADLERAQNMANMELELEYSRILRLLLEEKRSTSIRATGTAEVPSDRTERMNIQKGRVGSKKTSSTSASGSSNRIFGVQSGSSSSSSNNDVHSKQRKENHPREEGEEEIPPTKKERKN